MWALSAVCLLGSKRSIKDFQILCTWVELLALDLGSVVTFWEGEVVDTKNYAFFTNKWKATSEVDIDHWTKFSSFSPLLSQVEVDGGKSLDLSNYQYIFMPNILVWGSQLQVILGK
ncbi:putative vacuolar import/degradation protein Vid24 [Helianthus annuus]|uniref:Vacuolar import/degradation protein Vid24 n=1 Tax=Helianthus annuus TaxID=4232 RepID=A0A9K3J8E2_HELAN|nr:putative vacuolar import/degradation protein Vid24 [Helianthus annuus]KAJ0581126.1 putative vacuolar import/degradation protein Vid24 [Helianthus annuus]KAJ0588928.1 putative vacuolar import/degradation protein Vid24 [Helianthus annuus]KAJ0597070.1 putative vacuolar import/degradation protein Vid24 [Helianthus annuus]KAJ0757752.1 putative vacuolar import/degradation protein Vid24 [Helianthus annuus]